VIKVPHAAGDFDHKIPSFRTPISFDGIYPPGFKILDLTEKDLFFQPVPILFVESASKKVITDQSLYADFDQSRPTLPYH